MTAQLQRTERSRRSQNRIVALLRVLAPDEGYNLTALPSVRESFVRTGRCRARQFYTTLAL